jgi:GTP cyclohydrolase II
MVEVQQTAHIAPVVYNARKRGEDRASDYFRRTENIAGIKDMRFQALMPDILHWLGIKKIDRMLSMSKSVATFLFLKMDGRLTPTNTA